MENFDFYILLKFLAFYNYFTVLSFVFPKQQKVKGAVEAAIAGTDPRKVTNTDKDKVMTLCPSLLNFFLKSRCKMGNRF